MRILVISHTYTVDLNCEKLRSLARLDPALQVTVAVPQRWRPGGVQHRPITSQPQVDGNFRIQPLSHFSQNHQGLLTFGPDLVSLMQQFRPQVIQVEQGAKSLAYAQTITLNRLLRLQAKNLLFTWWNLPYRLRFPASRLEAYNLQHTHGLIAGNQDAAAILRHRGYTGPYRVMPQLGVDETRFQPQPQPALARQLEIPDSTFVVGFVGRFVLEKGLLTLWQALATLRHHPQPWILLLLGRGELQQALQQTIAAAGLSDRVRWVESVPHTDVPRYINLMDVLVLPSETTRQFQTLTASGWKEQFGHVLIEAMACRVPVIGSDSGEIPQVIQDAGLIFPEGDAAALAAHLRSLMEAPEYRQDLAQQGYRRTLTHYTNQALAQKLLAFYQELSRFS